MDLNKSEAGPNLFEITEAHKEQARRLLDRIGDIRTKYSHIDSEMAPLNLSYSRLTGILTEITEGRSASLRSSNFLFDERVSAKPGGNKHFLIRKDFEAYDGDPVHRALFVFGVAVDEMERIADEKAAEIKSGKSQE